MYARVVTLQTQPGKLDEFLRLFEEDFIPAIKGEQGFRNVFLLTDRSTNKGVGIAIYDSEADVKASDSAFRDRASKAASLLSERPVANTYEVNIQT